MISRSQKDYLSRFKGADPRAKFSSLKWTTGQTGCPILSECLAYLECELKTYYRPGNHTLFIGQVVDAAVFADIVKLHADRGASSVMIWWLLF